MQATRSPSSRATPVAAWLLGLTVVAGIVVRLHTSSDLWLDEALTVNISKLPVGELLRHLKHDGHPPLYYLLLHVWMKAFGSGDNAVRSLSTIFSILTIPPFVLIARRVGGKVMATAALVLIVTSPFAVRYATETRMYSLEILLVTLGWLAVHWALERPSIARLVPVALLSGLLALTHYWSLYLLAALGCMLLFKWRRRGDSAALLVDHDLIPAAGQAPACRQPGSARPHDCHAHSAVLPITGRAPHGTTTFIPVAPGFGPVAAQSTPARRPAGCAALRGRPRACRSGRGTCRNAAA